MSLPDHDPEPIARFTVESLQVVVHQDRAQSGRAAAREVARAIATRQAEAGLAQRRLRRRAEPERGPRRPGGRPRRSTGRGSSASTWTNTSAWAPTTRPRSAATCKSTSSGSSAWPTTRLRLIPGEQADRPLRTCLDYEDLLLAEPTDIVCAGIGENGHLAFNDPPVADFLDPVLVKVVRLDAACRTQQLNDGCFERIEDVPTHAYTLTVPALLAAPIVSVVVPGPRKAEAVLATLRGPFGESCPATALRRHPGATLYLDRESARHVL